MNEQKPKPRPKHRPRWPWNASTARRAASDIVEHAAAEVDREYTLESTWDLVSQCWPRERRSVMREIIYRRYSWW
jgi:hypothetical protein